MKRCSICGKSFNCPANLASHKRWHKPADQEPTKSEVTSINSEIKTQSQINLEPVLFYNQFLFNNFYTNYYSLTSQTFFQNMPLGYASTSNDFVNFCNNNSS